jgi:hypothetical protein
MDMLRSLISKKNFLFIKILLVLAFSLLHGLLYFYPDFKQNLIIDKDLIYFSFHDGNYFYNSDEITHGPAIRRFYDFFRFGTFNFNDPITGTNISSYNLMIFPYILGGFISYILGGVDKFFFYKNFIFPFCGYLFSFFLLRTFFRSFLICLFGAILFYGELFAIQHILKYLIFDPLLWSKETGLNVQALYYPSRQLGLILYFVALFVIFKVLENKDYQNKLIFIIFILAVSSIYHYLAIGLIIFTIFLIAFFFDLDFKKKIFYSGFFGFVFSAPIILYNFFQENREDMLMAYSFTKTMNFNIIPYALKSLSFLVITFFIYFYTKKKRDLILIILFFAQAFPLLFFSYFSYHFFIIPEPQHYFINFHFYKIFCLLMILQFMHNYIKNKFFVIIPLFILSMFFFVNMFNWQINIVSKNPDMIDKQYKQIIDWINKNSNSESSIMTLDPTLLNAIPTLTGRYNYIPSLKSLNPVSIEIVYLQLIKTKKLLSLDNNFDNFINNSCKTKDRSNPNRFCEYLFYGYFEYDQGSYSYKINKNKLPKDMLVPKKNINANMITYINIDLSKKEKEIGTDIDILNDLPNYIIIGPLEKKLMTNSRVMKNYDLKFSTKEYLIFEKRTF